MSPPTRPPIRRPRTKATTMAPPTEGITTPEPTIRPGLEDYEPFVNKNVITEDELMKLKEYMRDYVKRTSARTEEEPPPKRCFNLYDPPKITPRMNGTSRIRTQLYGHRVLQLCGAILEQSPPLVPCYDGYNLTFDHEIREKIRAMQKLTPNQLQTAFERADLQRLREHAATIRPWSKPTRHNKSSRIRYRSVRNELVPSERFRQAFIMYRRPPFSVNTGGGGCRSTLPQKLPPIGKREIWMYPDKMDDASKPPLTSQKKTPPPPDGRPQRLKTRPALKPFKKQPRAKIKHEEVLPLPPKPQKRELRTAVPRRSTTRGEPYPMYRTRLPIVSINPKTPIRNAAFFTEDFIDVLSDTNLPDDNAECPDLRPLGATATATATASEARTLKANQMGLVKEESGKTIATRPSLTSLSDLDSLFGLSDNKKASVIANLRGDVSGAMGKA